MDGPDDQELLRRFAEGGSQAAFAELVNRHIGMVYAAALRQVHDPSMAEDVAQAVFIILSKKASSHRPPRVLSAWLLGTARYAAANANRIARRRSRHERSAAEQRTRQMGTASNTIDPGQHPTDDAEKSAVRLGEELDAAMSRLTRRGREALVLRFFADKSFKDVGRELGISEEAAKQRVFRSLETLREMLSARGVRVPVGTLAAMLPVAAIRPAPAGLAAAAKLAAGKTAAAAGPAAIAKGAMIIMIWTKAKAVVTAAAVGILVGGTSVVLVYHLARDRDEIVASTVSAIRRVDFQPVQQVTDPRRPGVAYSHSIAQGRVAIQVEYVPRPQAGRAPYQRVPPPSADDAGTHATFSVVAGSLPDVAMTGSSDPLRCLNDGKMPADEDSPNDNFRFAIGTGEGRVKADLGRTLTIAQINTYSWHTDTRAPQYYRVYGSNGDSPGFDPSPGVEREPATCGWKQIASVDTRPSPMHNSSGGRYAVGISSPTGQIGRYRYLLFVMLPTEIEDGCGHTFYSEIDIVEKK